MENFEGILLNDVLLICPRCGKSEDYFHIFTKDFKEAAFHCICNENPPKCFIKVEFESNNLKHFIITCYENLLKKYNKTFEEVLKTGFR